MKHEKKSAADVSRITFRHSLRFRVYLYFALGFVAITVVIGSVMLWLYNSNSIENYSKELDDKATNIASRMSEFAADQDYTSYASYVELLDEVEPADVWLISNAKAKNPMSARMENVHLGDVALNTELQHVIDSALKGVHAYTVTTSNVFGEAMITLGAPITDGTGETIGVVLLNASINGYKQMVSRIGLLIVFACLFGILVAFGMASLFTRRLTGPILNLSTVAQKLAGGDYTVQAEVHGRDEIAELGNVMNVLSKRLGENETAQKNMEQMRLDFFANVSHELRTPITVIRGYTETLADGVVTEQDKVQRYYDRMLAECKSMERLVADLLVLSKMQNPDFKIEKEPVDLIQILDDIVRGQMIRAGQKCIGLIFDKDSLEYCMLPGDYDRLKQMFVVIIDNAIKFTDSGKNVTVTIRRLPPENGTAVPETVSGDAAGTGAAQPRSPEAAEAAVLEEAAAAKAAEKNYEAIRQAGAASLHIPPEVPFRPEHARIMVRIADGGTGIEPKELPNIFERFYRSKLRQNATGSGLGLPIARQICLKHGGSVDVLSASGVGTAFTFVFEEVSLENYE